jgi:hypothetical protein
MARQRINREPGYGFAREDASVELPDCREEDGAGLHQARHPLPARNEWGEDRGEGKPIKTRLLSPALLRNYFCNCLFLNKFKPDGFRDFL